MPYLKMFNHIAGFVILNIMLLAENGCVTVAAFKKGSIQNSVILKEQSSNKISVKEEKNLKAEEQLYYLPLQTVFGESHTLEGGRSVFTTLPPHISIDPAPIQIKYPAKTSVLYEDAPAIEYQNAVSQCVSETPVIELESRFLFPSKDVIKDSVIMSGHLEIASKTSSIEEALELVSKPSVALQGTQFHSHTIPDL